MIVNLTCAVSMHQQIKGGDHETRFDRCKCHVIGVSALG
jgi:hypothetical protein